MFSNLKKELLLDVDVHHDRLVHLVRKLEPDSGLVLAKPDDRRVSVCVPEKSSELVLTRTSKIYPGIFFRPIGCDRKVEAFGYSSEESFFHYRLKFHEILFENRGIQNFYSKFVEMLNSG